MYQLTVPVYSPAWNQMAAKDWGVDSTDDLELVLSSPYKIAALPALCSLQYHFTYCEASSSIPFDKFDLVILTDIEYSRLSAIHEWINQVGIKHYVLAVGGLHMNESLNESCELYRPWWCYNLLRFNEYRDTSSSNKSFQFEALLGARRPHRDYVMLGLQNNNMLGQSIVTYRDVFYGGFEDPCTEQVKQQFPDNELIWPYISLNLRPEWEVCSEITNSVSPFMPYGIYQNTNYSIVCETLAGYTEFFMSEKTSKVFMAKRVFVIFANYQFLKNLKSIGFQTFDSVIDESYDNVLDTVTRYAQAFEQVKWLSKQSADLIYKKLKPVLDHNHNRLFSLRDQTQQHMKELLRQHIPANHWKCLSNEI